MAAKALFFLLIAVTVAILPSDALYLKRTFYSDKPLPGERLEQFLLRTRESLPRLPYAEDEKWNKLRFPFFNDKRSEGCVDEKGTTFCKTFIQDDADKKVYCSLDSNIFVSQANFVEFTQFACKATCGNC
ncbi:unnamed protein product [Porites lobata]|uniref:Uncharacterized protein n=1 Tax=Porites lobata TaxID=104759 RepID=A0ABN8S309_9CNID|nr:unnamed protein product [Porites lobata]